MEDQNLQSKRTRHGFLTKLRNLAVDRRGMGAVEFALIAPVLLSLYISSFELTVGLSAAKRVTRTASAIADLVTRETSVSKSTLATMENVANSLFSPYKAKSLSIKITGVTIDSNGKATVAWSWDKTGGKPYAVGASVTVPEGMRVADTFLIHSEVSVSHDLLLFMTGSAKSGYTSITLAREFFYRQRTGTSISCTDCS